MNLADGMSSVCKMHAFFAYMPLITRIYVSLVTYIGVALRRYTCELSRIYV